MSRTKSSILDSAPPARGAAADAYAVACTAGLIQERLCLQAEPDNPNAATYRHPSSFQAARHACALHRISGQLHRIAERQCNEDLTCQTCGGTGDRIPGCDAALGMGGKLNAEHRANGIVCRACAGEGSTMGRKLAKLRRDAAEIATHYGLRVYFQTDPRGCSLYLIDPAMIPDAPSMAVMRYPNDSPDAPDYLERLKARWIAANYDRGHAVVRLGR